MGLIADEIKELRQMVKHLDAGKLTTEQVRTKLNIYKETMKRARLILDVYIACASPHLVEKRLQSLNLISRGELIQTPPEIELEMVVCREQGDKAITREECLSFSGDMANMKNCKSCENFAITRKLLLPSQEEVEKNPIYR